MGRVTLSRKSSYWERARGERVGEQKAHWARASVAHVTRERHLALVRGPRDRRRGGVILAGLLVSVAVRFVDVYPVSAVPTTISISPSIHARKRRDEMTVERAP